MQFIRLFLLLLGGFAGLPAVAAGNAKHYLLIVWDGMRPDFLSPELTPTLWSLRTNGVWFANHRSVYPTSTEVNGAVLATGGFPQNNGIVGNREYRPQITPLGRVPTQALAVVRRGDALMGGNYLGLPTVAELTQAQHGRTAVVGAKPVAFLHDRKPRPADSPNGVWFVESALPESRYPVLTNRFGPFPPPTSPNLSRDLWAMRCLTEAFWEGELPRYSVLWLSEPDYSQHEHGPGSAEALAAIANCDQRLAAVLAVLDQRGARDQTDIFVVSDHGFSTIGANVNVGAALRAAGFNARSEWDQPPRPGDIVVVGNGGSVLLYVIGRNRETVAKVVRALQPLPSTGVIFTREALPGTFPLAEARIASAQAPDIVVASRWTRQPDSNGHPVSLIFNDGYTEYDAGCGMHVTLCPTDLHNIAVASGPDFHRGMTSSVPSGNVDIAPTSQWLMGLQNPKRPDGRVLSEALTVKGPAVGVAKSDRRDARVGSPQGVWEQYLKFTEVNGVRYLDEGNGSWTPRAAAPESSPAKGTTLK